MTERAYAQVEMFLEGYDPNDWDREPTELGLNYGPVLDGAVPSQPIGELLRSRDR